MNDGLVRTTQCPLVTFSENQAQSLSPQFLSLFFFFLLLSTANTGSSGSVSDEVPSKPPTAWKR